MKIHFAGAFYKKIEESSFKIKFVDGTKECVLLHFYHPMVITIDGKQIETQANACILYRPDTPQIYWGRSSEFENDYIRFLPEDMSFFNDFQIPFNEIFYVTDSEIIKREMMDITYFLTERWENHDHELLDRLCKVMSNLQVNRLYPTTKTKRDSETRFRLNQLRKEVSESPEKWTVDRMADHFFLTRSHFSVLYKKTFGVTPQSDIHFFINEKALRLLNTTDLTIQEISQQCGYNECENFIRAFKKTNGTSPHQYRKTKLQ
ncbi:MAG: helix-turn-helix transcriptional regulator [Treponema sp.]|nr:helix-turn-helix transcriptional regulator [Candidatus Treponema equi]